MSKVLVDRELLERIVNTNMADYAVIAYQHKEIRAILVQPAEAEGVEARLRTVIDELKAGFVVCEECGGQEDTATLDCVPELEAIAAALSAVTAERDRLREEMAELWKRIDKFQSQSHGITALAEIERLRAEVERYVPLHEAVQRAAGELPEGWAIQLYIERDGGGVELIGPDGTEDFATNNERLDYTVIDALEAAMAAKEA